MAETGVQINWGSTGTADAVSAARRAMQVAGKPVFQPKTVARAAPSQAPAAAVAVEPKTATKPQKARVLGGTAGMPSLYAAATLLLISLGVAGIWQANVAYAPEMYASRGLMPAVKAFNAGKNYAVFDLNLNIRRMKELYVETFTETPEVVLVGASQWQEAHAELMKSRKMFNGHIHRDYWEDILAQVEVYARNKRLPKQMIIAVRDKQFTPVALRTDFLWEPGIPNYEAMSRRLGIKPEDWWKTYPYQRIKERLSLSMLFDNVTRWFHAEERPHATNDLHFKALDTLLPDGSILWSAEHLAIFTPERAEREAKAHADNLRFSPPVIDPVGVAAFDKLLTYLKDQGTEVTLVHPPYNPIFYEHVKGGTFFEGLNKIRALTVDLAAKHGLKVIGDFDPAKVGCTAAMYIDAEHSNPDCVVKIMQQFDELNMVPATAIPGGES